LTDPINSLSCVRIKLCLTCLMEAEMEKEELEMVLKLLEENGLLESLADCRKQGYEPREILRDLIERSEELEDAGW